MMTPKFKRILIKLSGEGLAGTAKTGIDTEVIRSLVYELKQIVRLGVKVCVVIGGGNFFRGAKNATADMDRSIADQVGMLATVMNALALRSALLKADVEAVIYSGFAVPRACENYNFEKATQALQAGKVVIFAGGTGNPYFTTDTGAALRAVEMHCDVLMKATQVDGVYSADPRTDPSAERYERISYTDVLAKHLNVMDMAAISMAADNKLPIMIFALKEQNSLLKAVCGEIKNTMIE